MAASLAIHREPRHAEVVRLLERAALPTSDLTDEDMRDFFYVGPANAPIGIVGVQLYGADALLRSLVVTQEHRAHGLGRALVERAEQHAREGGASKIYLLTTTAESFFRSRDYVPTSRDGAPLAIRSTPEFAGLCPASSAFLSKQL
ncbi:arsenic resistance N-acetyltransferase ArsN2 [Peristeroidobacter soli]|uniref:arsenic resistance N-acetyltransferase ArsN2 n=1 Tax=Peristeroidobacter soli TaxID=2497877 RepID=UPI00101C30EC|nr:arsenic resistance N-acetyltransferase ArsN2 [Peristeroidobacter soli]